MWRWPHRGLVAAGWQAVLCSWLFAAHLPTFPDSICQKAPHLLLRDFQHAGRTERSFFEGQLPSERLDSFPANESLQCWVEACCFSSPLTGCIVHGQGSLSLFPESSYFLDLWSVLFIDPSAAQKTTSCFSFSHKKRSSVVL